MATMARSSPSTLYAFKSVCVPSVAWEEKSPKVDEIKREVTIPGEPSSARLCASESRVLAWSSCSLPLSNNEPAVATWMLSIVCFKGYSGSPGSAPWLA
jgi:hypothetical protein